MEVRKLTIEIDNFDNSAMVDDRNAEVCLILRSLIDRIITYGIPNQDGRKLMDSNGQQVGLVTVEWD